MEKFQKKFLENKLDALQEVFSSLFYENTASSYSEKESDLLAQFISSQIPFLTSQNEIKLALDILLFLKKNVQKSSYKYFIPLLSHSDKNIRMKTYRLLTQNIITIPEHTLIQQLQTEKDIEALFPLIQALRVHSPKNAIPFLKHIQKNFKKELEGSAAELLLHEILQEK